MQATWNAITSKLTEIAPQIIKELNPGITDVQLENLERKIGKKLPESFIAFYRVHNGQHPDSAGLIDGEELLSFERILKEWGIWKELLDGKTFEDDCGPYTSEPDEEIKEDWWNASWIPITYDGCGNHYCLDLDPSEGGNYGQIIRMWHDGPERTLEAESFETWIKNYAKRLVNDELIYSEDYFGIVEKF